MSIHYKVLGEGFPVVMIHGWTLDHRMMMGCMEPVFATRDGWKRIYLDLPGMGASDSPEHIQNSDDMLNEVLRLLDNLIPNSSFLLCGQSYGGYISLGIAHLRKDLLRGICLIAPKVLTDNEKLRRPEKQMLKQDSALMASLTPQDAEDFAEYAVIQGPTEWSRFQQNILSGARVADNEFLARIRQNGYGISFKPEIGDPLEIPALVVTGRQDHVTGYENQFQLMERFPRGTFAVLDMAGHNLQIERPMVFEAFIHDWLDRIELTQEENTNAVYSA